jgi:aryl-alcohol dehydrogenase-like predicted oxidoreductase
MNPRLLGRSGIAVTPIGFGAFKIGRNEKTKYAASYALPDEVTVERLLCGLLDMGVAYIDTAPAYGLSEERIGRAVGQRRSEFTLSSKVGESFEHGESRYDFSAVAVRASIEQSLRRLKTDVLDIVFIHSDGRDIEIQQSSDAVPTLVEIKRKGLVRAIGLSGKTAEGARLALDWADVIMVEYHVEDPSHGPVIAAAAERGVGVVVKKGLASGKLPPEEAIGFVLGNAGVASLVIGGLNLEHYQANVSLARQVAARRGAGF